MIRRSWFVLLGLCLCLWLQAAAALADDPRVSVELDGDSTPVGQPLVLRIKVLVPTWLPSAPVFPDLDMPGLLIRLPERASGPVSETVDGETWSGVQRAYRLYPLAEGRYVLPAGQIAVAYAEPGKPDPIAYSAPLPEIAFDATLPAGARALSPPILANGFTLEQSVEGNTDLTVGDAVTRVLTGRIDGTTAVLIPQLAPATQAAAFRAYPRDPVVRESDNRGTLSGSRSETVTYVAQTDGTAKLPAVSIDWFNLQTGKVETASVPEVALTVTGAPPPPPDPAGIARLAGLVVLIAAMAWGAWRLLGTRVKAAIAGLRRRWAGSELRADRAVIRAIRQRDLSATVAALDDWLGFYPAAAPAETADLAAALAAIGAAHYGPRPGDPVPAWRGVLSAQRRARHVLRSRRGRTATGADLPPLNP